MSETSSTPAPAAPDPRLAALPRCEVFAEWDRFAYGFTAKERAAPDGRWVRYDDVVAALSADLPSRLTVPPEALNGRALAMTEEEVDAARRADPDALQPGETPPTPPWVEEPGLARVATIRDGENGVELQDRRDGTFALTVFHTPEEGAPDDLTAYGLYPEHFAAMAAATGGEYRVPLFELMLLLERAYIDGALARETGPLVKHEGWQHAISEAYRLGVPVALVDACCRRRPGASIRLATLGDCNVAARREALEEEIHRLENNFGHGSFADGLNQGRLDKLRAQLAALPPEAGTPDA